MVFVVDIQGFSLSSGFVPKELAIANGNKTANFLLKSKIPYLRLTTEELRKVSWVTENHHGISYRDGFLEYEEIGNIFEKYFIYNNELIYVKGHQKKNFLLEFLPEERIVNLEVESFGVTMYLHYWKQQETLLLVCIIRRTLVYVH